MTNTYKIGSLFSGYGGLDIAVQNVFGGELSWYSEIEPAACTVMAAHHPNVKNIGDVKLVDWSLVEPVDILTGGYPCQPFSAAGKRKGTEDERHLFPYVTEAIRHLQPRLVVLENVRGHLTLGFDIVLGEIFKLGYDARWGIIRASDAGACHQRARVFIVAYPRGEGLQGRIPKSVNSKSSTGGHRHSSSVGSEGLDEEPTSNSTSTEWGGTEHEDMGATFRSTTKLGERSSTDWKKYEPSIRRWESVTRPVPDPTIIGKGTRPRLNPVFVEWMMGLPEGHVTGHGLSPSQELKMLGNGVVPQQAELAIRSLMK